MRRCSPICVAPRGLHLVVRSSLESNKYLFQGQKGQTGQRHRPGTIKQVRTMRIVGVFALMRAVLQGQGGKSVHEASDDCPAAAIGVSVQCARRDREEATAVA